MEFPSCKKSRNIRMTEHFDLTCSPLDCVVTMLLTHLPHEPYIHWSEFLGMIQHSLETMATPPMHPQVASMTASKFEAFRDSVWVAYLEYVRPFFVAEELYERTKVFVFLTQIKTGVLTPEHLRRMVRDSNEIKEGPLKRSKLEP